MKEQRDEEEQNEEVTSLGVSLEICDNVDEKQSEEVDPKESCDWQIVPGVEKNLINLEKS